MDDHAAQDAVHRIRRAVPEDADEVAACLDTLGYGTSATLVLERLSAFAGSSADVVFVAGGVAGERLVGVASAHALPLFHMPGQLVRLTTLAVRGEAQGRGTGRALVEAVEAWAWDVGARRIEVTSGDHRPLAHAFYEALGYVPDERRFIKRAASTVRST